MAEYFEQEYDVCAGCNTYIEYNDPAFREIVKCAECSTDICPYCAPSHRFRTDDICHNCNNFGDFVDFSE